MTHLDGNALAGLLAELFVPETSAARAECASCATVSQSAEWMVYLEAPGAVARCPVCHAVQLRLVRSDSTTWLDLSGIRYLQFEEAQTLR